jgi:hypothetical protein
MPRPSPRIIPLFERGIFERGGELFAVGDLFVGIRVYSWLKGFMTGVLAGDKKY